MRKMFLVGLGLALSVAGAAAAQQPGRDSAGAKAGHHGERVRGEGRRGGGPESVLLRGITLTDAQKEQFNALAEADRAKFEAQRDQNKKQFEEFRAARERGDTTAARAIMQRNRAAMEQARDQRIAAARSILTADQRVQFDKNLTELKDRMEKRDSLGPRKKGGRFGA